VLHAAWLHRLVLDVHNVTLSPPPLVAEVVVVVVASCAAQTSRWGMLRLPSITDACGQQWCFAATLVCVCVCVCGCKLLCLLIQQLHHVQER
jgi:hypothetical protein